MDSKSRWLCLYSALGDNVCNLAAFYPAATYTRPEGSVDSSLVIQPDAEPTYPIPWISVDPLNLPRDTPLRPIEVTVNEGETLFLPAGWYHHVTQWTGSKGICVAVN
jgi:jumonji domain-containing protein 7